MRNLLSGKYSTLIKLFTILTIILVTLGVYKYSNVFVISDISYVELGGEKLQYIDDEIINEINSEISSKKYFDINPQAIASDIYGKSRFVKSVFIYKTFPNKVEILISQREPKYLFEIDKKVCILIDNELYILEAFENVCADIDSKYSGLLIQSDDVKWEYEVGGVTTYYPIEQIVKIEKVFESYSITLQKVDIIDNVAYVNAGNNKVYVMSLNQEVELQLSRLVAVLNELEKKGIKFNKIDLRFKRPVLQRK